MSMMMITSLIFFIIFIINTIHAIPDQACPDWFKQSGIANDIATLSYSVALDSEVVNGTCGLYIPLHTVSSRHGVMYTHTYMDRSMDQNALICSRFSSLLLCWRYSSCVHTYLPTYLHTHLIIIIHHHQSGRRKVCNKDAYLSCRRHQCYLYCISLHCPTRW